MSVVGKIGSFVYIPSGTTVDSTLFSTTGSTAVEMNQVRLAATASITTKDQYDATGSYMSWQASDHATGADGTFYGQLSATDGVLIFRITWSPITQQVTSYLNDGGGEVTEIDDFAVTDPFFRIRTANGIVYFEASADGTYWTILSQQQYSAQTTSMAATFGTTVGTFWLQQVNLDVSNRKVGGVHIQFNSVFEE